MSSAPTTNVQKERDAASGAPFRVGLCITELDPGGAEQCLVELATRLDPSRFTPIVYCLGPRPASNPTSLADRLEQAGVTVRFFNARRAWQLPWILWQLRRQMQADRLDLVQTFLFHANVLGTLAARLAGVRQRVMGIRVAERRRGWHLTLARWCDRWVERHVCVSQAVRDFSSTTGRLPAEKLVVIGNGVDVDRFAGAKPVGLASLGIPADRRVIVSIGRLDRQKGLDELLALMPRLLSQWLPDHDWLVVGRGPELERLSAQAKQLGIAERVHFAGYRSDIPAILAASEVMILPSRWEGMPNVLLEAMAASRPVVAFSVEGVNEVLGTLAAEQMAPVGEPQVFVDKLVAILTVPAAARRLGQENQARVRESFSLSGMAHAYETLFRELLATENRG